MKLNLLLAAVVACASVGSVAAQQQLTLGAYNLAEGQDQDNYAYDGFNNQASPIVPAYVYSGTQTIYLPEQLAAMKGKSITKLSFKCFSENWNVTEYASQAKLYLQEVDAVNFAYDEAGKYYSWFAFDQDHPTVVQEISFDPQTAAANGEDITIDFDLSANPYAYTGKTLLVTVDNERTTSEDAGNIRFYWVPFTKGEVYRTAVYASDKANFQASLEKNTAILAEENEVRWPEAPAVQFTYKAEQSGAEQTLSLTCGVTAGDGSLNVMLGQPAHVAVYTLTGSQVLLKQLAAGSHSLSVPAGAYVVKVGNQSFKAIVR